MINFRQFWNRLRYPRAGNTRDGILHYFTNVVLFWMTISFWIIVLVFAVSLWLNIAINPSSDMPIAAVISAVLLTFAFWLAYKGNWQFARIIPVGLMFGLSFYSAYFYGLGIVLLIEISLAILLAVLMWFDQVRWWWMLGVLVLLVVIGTLRMQYIQPGELFYYFSISTFYLLVFTGLVVFLSREYSASRDVIQYQLDGLLQLREVDSMIISGAELGKIFQGIVDNLAMNTSVDACSILLWEQGSGFEFGAAAGFSDNDLLRSHLATAADLVMFKVIINHQEVIWKHSEPILSDRLKRIFQQETFEQYQALPIKSGEIVIGVLELFYRREQSLSDKELAMVTSLLNRTKLAVQRIRLIEDLEMARLELEVAYMDTLKGWVRMLDLRDKETEHHTLRVTALTQRLAEKMGITGDDLVNIGRGALLHDIGKMGIPDEILNKPGPLTDEEWVIMRKHPEFAYEFLKSIDFLAPILEIPYCHHEKWDGSGYPRGLAGEQIPKEAQIFSLIDVLDALLSDRPYRKAWTEDKAIQYIREKSGTHFDPAVVAAFFEMMEEEGDNFMNIRSRIEKEGSGFFSV